MTKTKQEPKTVKVTHVAEETWLATPEGIKKAYDRCHMQIVGAFLSNDVVIENAMSTVVTVGDSQYVTVVMLGYRMYGEEELRRIRAADRAYAKCQEAMNAKRETTDSLSMAEMTHPGSTGAAT